MKGLAVILKHYLVAGFKLGLGIDTVFLKESHVLFINEPRKNFGSGAEIVKSTLLSLFNPFVGVAVSVEDNALVSLDGLLKKCVNRFGELSLRNIL